MDILLAARRAGGSWRPLPAGGRCKTTRHKLTAKASYTISLPDSGTKHWKTYSSVSHPSLYSTIWSSCEVGFLFCSTLLGHFQDCPSGFRRKYAWRVFTRNGRTGLEPPSQTRRALQCLLTYKYKCVAPEVGTSKFKSIPHHWTMGTEYR